MTRCFKMTTRCIVLLILGDKFKYLYQIAYHRIMEDLEDILSMLFAKNRSHLDKNLVMKMVEDYLKSENYDNLLPLIDYVLENGTKLDITITLGNVLIFAHLLVKMKIYAREKMREMEDHKCSFISLRLFQLKETLLVAYDGIINNV